MPTAVPSHTAPCKSCPGNASLSGFLITCALLMQVGSVLAAPLPAAQLATLSEDPEWLALGHYHRARWYGQGYESYVDDPAFFLAPGGKHDPAAELAATLSALRAPFDGENTHPLCRYPARANWLRSKLGAASEIAAEADCVEYRAWRARLDPGSVTLVFASAYLNSPSSMYGHTLLRIDPADQKQDSEWLSWAVNFGANLTGQDNSMLYAWRGLAGGYPGTFSVMPYYEKIQSYSRLENRDLWEYRLDLRPDEVQRLVTHLWELRKVNFDYYFLDENCSFRLLELLDVARPGLDLALEYPLWVIPVDTVRTVYQADLVTDMRYRPAHASRLEALLAGLSDKQREVARMLSADDGFAANATFVELNPDVQRRVVLAAYRHLRYQHDRLGRDAAIARRSHALLRLMKQLGRWEETDPPIPDPPQDGHRSQRLGAGLGARDGRAIGEFEWRISYHDLLDNRVGYREGAAISMGRLRGQWSAADGIELEAADLLEIISLSPRNRFRKPVSWRVQAGFERLRFTGEDPLVPHVDAAAGLAWERGGWLLAPFLGGRLEYNPLLAENLGLGAGAGLLALTGNRYGSALLQLDVWQFDEAKARRVWRFEQQFEIDSNRAVRFRVGQSSGQLDSITEATMSWLQYF